MADDVRAKNTGTFDRTTNTWRLRGKGIQISVRQLSKRYGKDIPNTIAGSRPYWRKFLQDLEDGHRAARRAASPLQDRIRSIEAMLVRLRAEGRPESELERFEAMLAEAEAVPAHDTDHLDLPVLHPDAEYHARVLRLENSDWGIGLMNNMIPAPPKPTANGIKHEADVFLERHRSKDHKGWYPVRQALDLFLEQTGDIPLNAVTVHHWRKLFSALKMHPTWGDRTRYNQLGIVTTFLTRVAADHGLNYGFIRNPDYRLPLPDGRKVQYTLEQVKTALEHATGEVRMALLLGLNAGMSWADMERLTPEMVQNGHIVCPRAKLLYRKNPVVGSWLLWPETKAVLKYGVIVRRLEVKYTEFKNKHGLPEHKALRKTTAQMIEDEVGEKEARLFRGEGPPGTHGKNYIVSFTPTQVRKLDHALGVVGRLYGLNEG